MVKKMLLCSSLVGLVGCGTTQVKEVDNYYSRPLPIYVVPAPPEINKPTFVIDTITDAQKNNDGELVKAYAASTVQLRAYADKLEVIVDKYKLIAKLSMDKLQAFIDDSSVTMDTTVDTWTEDDWKEYYNKLESEFKKK